MSEKTKRYTAPAVNGIDGETAEKLKRLSAFSLPDRPSQQGMKPDQIKRRFYEPIIESDISVVNQVNRIVKEVNTANEKACEAVNELFEEAEKVSEGLLGKVDRGELEGEVAKFNENADTAIAEFKQSGEEAIERIAEAAVEAAVASLEGKGDDAISTFEEKANKVISDVETDINGKLTNLSNKIENVEQTLANVFIYDTKHTFTSRDSFEFNDVYPYCKLMWIEGSDEYNRSPNLIPNEFYWNNGKTVNGVKVSVDENHIITLNGTPSSTMAVWYIHSSQKWKVEPDVYYFSGRPSGVSGSFYTRLKAIDKDLNTIKQWYDYGDGVECDLRALEYDVLCVGIYMYKGETFNNVKFKLQLERGDQFSEYVGQGVSEAETPPTRIEIELDNGEQVLYYKIPQKLLTFLEDKEYGYTGNRIDFTNKEYLWNTFEEGRDISEYLDNSILYFGIISGREHRVKIYSGDKLLHYAKCGILIQHTTKA